MNAIQTLVCGTLLLTLALPSIGAESEVGGANNSSQVGANPTQRLALPELPPRDTFQEILERPLFSNNRRPDPSTSETGAMSARELRETWRLTGVFLVGEEQKALLRLRDGERNVILTTGMPLDDTWMLNEITPEAVIMDSGDEQVRLELLEPRDTEPVASMAQPTETEEADSEVRRLDERAREAAEQLQQDLQTTRDERNE